MLFNKLARIDVILVIAVLLLIFLKREPWQSVLLGVCAVLFLFSIINHIKYYKEFKKFY